MNNKYMFFENAYFIIGTSYAGKSTMVKELAKKHSGIACEENYHDTRIWNYIKVRSTKERTLYKYVNGQAIKKKFKPEPEQKCVNRENIVYCLDFTVTPHQLRHTYITNLIYAGIDPKTVQYLAGHENSKVTMDIYAKAKYNKPKELSSVVNTALKKQSDDTPD